MCLVVCKRKWLMEIPMPESVHAAALRALGFEKWGKSPRKKPQRVMAFVHLNFEVSGELMEETLLADETGQGWLIDTKVDSISLTSLGFVNVTNEMSEEFVERFR